MGAAWRSATDYAAVATDARGMILAFNRGAEVLTGYDAVDMVERQTIAALHDQDELGSSGIEALGISPAAPDTITREWTYIRRDGSTLPVAVTVSKIPDESGETVGYLMLARDLTIEKQYAELSDSLERMFTGSPMATLVSSVRDGRILMANEACRDTLGRAPEALVGRTSLEAGLWVEPERREAQIAAFRAQGRLRNFPEEVRTPAGEVKQVLVSAELIEFAGEPCILVMCNDVTERHELGRALGRTERLLRAFLEHAPVLAAIKDRDGRYLLTNSNFQAAFVPDGGEVSGRTAEDLSAVLADTAAKIDAEVIETNAPVSGEYTLADASGEERTYLAVKFPLRDRDDNVYGIGTVATDITEIRAVADALRDARRESELARARLEAVLDAIADHAIAATDASGTVTVFNRGAERMLGYSADEMIGRNERDVMPLIFDPDEVAAVAQQTGIDPGPELFASPEAPHEWSQVRKGGERIRVEQEVRAIRDTQGRPEGWVLVARDVTDAKRQERELVEARARAEAADRAKSEFLSRMSHELRTPLNAILGFGQLLESAELKPDQSDYAARITSAGRHLLHLVNDVLDLSRIESGHLELSMRPVNVADVFDEAVALVEPLAEARSIRVQVQTAPAAAVSADRQRLKQILLNLLANAVKYNREGGEITLSAVPLPSGRLRLSVADSGPGIAAPERARVFLPFMRSDAPPDVEGTGLGLSVSKLLVEAMGGSIGVESELGRGSSFWIELARADESFEEAAPVTTSHGPVRGAEPRTVLYVEDNASNRHLVEKILTRIPEVDLVLASSGREGLRLATQRHPDLILLDLHLPDIDGEGILRRLRSHPATATVPVVIVSADATVDQQDRLTALGADGYLTKPFTIEELILTVRAGEAHGAGEERAVRGKRVLDADRLEQLSALDEDVESRGTLARLALSEAAAQVHEIAAAVGSSDARAVAVAAHGLRTSAGMIGAERVAALAAATEEAARGNTLPDAAAVAELHAALHAASNAVTHITEGHDAPRPQT